VLFRSKELKNRKFGLTDTEEKIRYLSSNRIGDMEQFRSKTDQYTYSAEAYSLGDKEKGKQKHKIETATGDFFVMDNRKDIFIKVSERLSTLFNREVFLRWENGRLKVYFSNDKSNEEYSIVSEASGLLNVISILAALYDDDIKVLLIDEPEVSLHPQLQSFLLKEIKKVAGDYNDKGKKLIVISTHSTEMIDISKIDELCNYIFFSDDGSLPKQIDTGDEILKNKKLNELIIRMSQSYKTAFFSKHPLLVEGISDFMICKYLDDRYELNLEVAGTQILPVEGKGQFPVAMKLMNLIGKEAIILTDLDAFTDNNDIVNLFVSDSRAKEIALEKGHNDLQRFVNGVKTDLNRLCEENKQELKDIYKEHPYWKEKDEGNEMDSDQNNINKKIVRSLTALLFSTNDTEISQWHDGSKWIEIKKRISVLLDCLEECGCFILRNGALESYYMHTDECIFDGKPLSAIEEIEYLRNQSIDDIEKNYDVILRALRYSAKVHSINETIAIKRELLSEIAPILGQFEQNTIKDDLNSIIKQVKGNNKSLFNYEINYPEISIDINSQILDVKGFPLKVRKGDNINDIVNNNIKIKDK